MAIRLTAIGMMLAACPAAAQYGTSVCPPLYPSYNYLTRVEYGPAIRKVEYVPPAPTYAAPASYESVFDRAVAGVIESRARAAEDADKAAAEAAKTRDKWQHQYRVLELLAGGRALLPGDPRYTGAVDVSGLSFHRGYGLAGAGETVYAAPAPTVGNLYSAIDRDAALAAMRGTAEALVKAAGSVADKQAEIIDQESARDERLARIATAGAVDTGRATAYADAVRAYTEALHAFVQQGAVAGLLPGGVPSRGGTVGGREIQGGQNRGVAGPLTRKHCLKCHAVDSATASGAGIVLEGSLEPGLRARARLAIGAGLGLRVPGRQVPAMPKGTKLGAEEGLLLLGEFAE